MVLDDESYYPFKTDGHTIHDYEARFAAEDAGKIPCGKKFRWSWVLEGAKPEPQQISIDDYLKGLVKP